MYSSEGLVRSRTPELAGKLRDVDGWPRGFLWDRWNIMEFIHFIVVSANGPIEN